MRAEVLDGAQLSLPNKKMVGVDISFKLGRIIVVVIVVVFVLAIHGVDLKVRLFKLLRLVIVCFIALTLTTIALAHQAVDASSPLVQFFLAKG